ncbi:MAG: nucleotidyltransferase family protein [Chromatiales bacterium]|jgi:molybdenum cofactor cytidylyltransferase
MPEITGLLLAAGLSRRFGSPKLLHQIRGKPLILSSAACLRACDRLLAVIRPDDFPLHQCLQQAGIDTVINPRADQGMGSSLACGIAASPSSDGWCILPADMPFVGPQTGQRVVQALVQGVAIAAPYFQERRGHPVGFSRAYRERLLALQGDIGARAILVDESRAIVRIQVEDPGILRDVDSPQDLST